MRAATTILVFCVTALLALGMVMLYSSSMADAGGAHDFVMQLAWCVLGVGAGLLAATTDYRLLKKLTWPLFGLAVVLLVLVLVPHIGSKMNGARRWFRLPVGGVRFQPSELGKMALIVVLAWYGDRCQRRMSDWKKGMVIPGLFIGIILGLIFVEPDRGTTILMGLVAGGMLLIAGVRWRHLAPPVLLGVLLISISILHDPVRRERVLAWIHPEEQKMGTGLQADRAKLALGSGGWTGVGLGNSRQKLGYLPFHNTDFILPIIGEELGLVATLLVVTAFGLVVICGLAYIVAGDRRFRNIVGFGNYPDDRITGGDQHWRGDGRAAEQGHPAAIHQLRWVQSVDHADEHRVVVEHRPAGARGAGEARAGRNAIPATAVNQDEQPAPRIAIACGGTGGHLFPGLAVAEELKHHGCAVTLLISPKEVDQQAVKSATGVKIVTLPAVGLSKGSRMAFVRGFWDSYCAARNLFKTERPEAVLAMGGFTSAPPVLAGKFLGARVFLHESNTIPGRANRWLSWIIHQAFLGFGEAAPRLHARAANENHRHTRARRIQTGQRRRMPDGAGVGSKTAGAAGNGRKPGRQRAQ